MGITISADLASRVLEAALADARSEVSLPASWEAFARRTFAMSSKTYVPALGTALLARATDARVDPLSIKASYSENSYSLRTLCHTVLVPAALRHGFSIRNTGREPLNNQPFFRYDHMTEIDRVRNRPQHDSFIAGLRPLAASNGDEAAKALSAFLRVALREAAAIETHQLVPGSRTLQQTRDAVVTFLAGGDDKPRRAQALVAAAMDVAYETVRTRRLNDPSRDFPGDVQAYQNEVPILSVEVRTKPMPETEVEAFSLACRRAGITRAVAAIFVTPRPSLHRQALHERVLLVHGVLLRVILSPESLLAHVLMWADAPLQSCIDRFVEELLERLKEIEADPKSLALWVKLSAPGGSET